MDREVLRAARIAVVGLEVTSGEPPLIVHAAVYHVDDGSIVAGPFSYWVEPDAPLAQVRISAWPNVRLAPPWWEVANRVTEVIGDRLLAVRDQDRLRVLQRHLPDWQPAGVILVTELAEQIRPSPADSGPTDSRPTDSGVDPVAGLAEPSRGAVAEAHLIALVLGALLRYAGP
jgi:hypothetical protein